MDYMDFAILCFSSLMAIVDPIGLIPAFLAITPEKSAEERIRISALACTLTFLVLSVFAFFGRLILKLLSVTLPAFQIAGGILLFFIAMDMLNARMTGVRQTQSEQDEGADKTDIAVTPLVIPSNGERYLTFGKSKSKLVKSRLKCGQNT